RRSLALAYSRSAIAITVPAGSAVSAAYAFRQFRADGASRAVATAVMLLSGLISVSGLVLLYVTGAAATGAERLAGAWRPHLTISLTTIAAVYLTVQIVRQIPLTPGGIGVIEVSLLAGLISAGAADGPATATVLVYRLLSCWLIIPVGLLCGLLLRRPVKSGSSIPAAPARSRREKRPAPQPVSLGYR